MAIQRALDAIKGVVFDMDDTLTISSLDFNQIRSESGVPQGQPILEFIRQAPEPDQRRVQAVLDKHERRAAQECTLREGTKEVLQELSRRGFKTALLTRNSAESVRIVLRRFGLQFDCWLSREHAEPKPSSAPVLRIADELALSAEELLVVGDYIFDVQAGHAAGARTAFLKTDSGVEPPPETDVVLNGLPELLDLLTRTPG